MENIKKISADARKQKKLLLSLPNKCQIFYGRQAGNRICGDGREQQAEFNI